MIYITIALPVLFFLVVFGILGAVGIVLWVSQDGEAAVGLVLVAMVASAIIAGGLYGVACLGAANGHTAPPPTLLSSTPLPAEKVAP